MTAASASFGSLGAVGVAITYALALRVIEDQASARNRVTAMRTLGEREGETARLKAAIAACREAIGTGLIDSLARLCWLRMP